MAAGHARFGDRTRLRRVAAAGLTASLHALALLVFLLPSAQAVPAPNRASLTTFDTVGEPAQRPAAAKAPQPRKVTPPPPLAFVAPPPAIEVPRLSPVVAAMLEQADAQASTGGCDLTGPVQAALQTSADVQRALPSIPQARRSVANAIALWNQRWVEADAMLDTRTLDVVRTTITATIAAASPACRQQLQAGPRLIYVPGQSDTTILALGSGNWTWQQVADSAEPELGSGPRSELALASGQGAVSTIANDGRAAIVAPIRTALTP